MRGVNGPGGGGYEPIPNYNTSGFGQQPANNSFGGGQPMGGYGGQQSQPMQQQMQRPMQSQFGGYNQSPQMGGFGGGMGGGFGGGFNQYNPMGGGYGMGGFSPQMGGMGGFGGGYGPQMGGFGMGGGGQPMGGYGGGMGGGFNQPPQMGGFGGGMGGYSRGGMGGYSRGGMQGMGQSQMQQPLNSGFANVSPETLQAERMAQGAGGMGGASSPQLDQQYQNYMDQMQGATGAGSQSVGQSSMSPQTFGALSNPGGMNQIPAYARPYAQSMRGMSGMGGAMGGDDFVDRRTPEQRAQSQAQTQQFFQNPSAGLASLSQMFKRGTF
jgi:hypothetical protein